MREWAGTGRNGGSDGRGRVGTGAGMGARLSENVIYYIYYGPGSRAPRIKNDSVTSIALIHRVFSISAEETARVKNVFDLCHCDDGGV